MLEAGIVVDVVSESKIELEGAFIIADMEDGCTSGVFDGNIIEIVGRTVDDVRDGAVWRASEPEREGVAELVPSTLSRLVLAATAVLNGKSSVLIGNSVVNPVAVLATRV